MPAWGKAGYSLVEVLVALAIFSLSAPGIAVGVSLAVRTTHSSANFTVATILAQDKLEELRARSGLRSGGGDSPRPGFSREWSIAPDSPETGMTRIDVAISWSDYESHSLALATVVNE
ncbi:MAG: prepilin-type N-terminal cleavage/methylation domain-containing protein [Deltaproteobacteria bacterium]|nr:prepilin-type N-terminal cleavage/methylation domain-containing protein [Deltaproteobacteria bacterium]